VTGYPPALRAQGLNSIQEEGNGSITVAGQHHGDSIAASVCAQSYAYGSSVTLAQSRARISLLRVGRGACKAGRHVAQHDRPVSVSAALVLALNRQLRPIDGNGKYDAPRGLC